MEETISEIQLPEQWSWVELKDLTENSKDDIVDGPFGSNLKSSEYIKTGIPVFKIQNIKENRFVDKNINFVSPTKAEELSRHSFQKGDLIITKLGNPLGLCCKVPEKYPYGIIVADLMRFRPSSRRVVVNYLMYGINSVIVQNQFKAITKGTTRPRVNLTIVRGIKFPLPPLPEQRAIVSKIEQLFSELDNGISNLKLAQEQLKVYQQAVLKKAFEGELTREWRKLNSTGESANKLLDLILEKKKSQWENNQLGKFKRTGKKPKDNLWKLKYKRPCSPDLANLPDLPKSWSWVSPEQITSWEDPYALAIGPFGSNLKVSDYTSEGVPLVFVRNIRSGVFDNKNTKYVSENKAKELRPHWINSLDILVTKMGEPPGDACLYPIGRPLAIITADCIKFRLCSLLDTPTYFVYAINSNIVRSQISSITLGVAQKKISLERFKTIALPLPPIEEQKAIVHEIETRLSVCDKIEQDIKENLEKAEALRQSILKKAFEGKLLNERELTEVRGAEDWEPAGVLLERIKAERRENS